MILTEPVHINFHCPAIDPLGRENLIGKLRFLSDHVELSWRMKGNVFTGGKSEMTVPGQNPGYAAPGYPL